MSVCDKSHVIAKISEFTEIAEIADINNNNAIYRRMNSFDNNANQCNGRMTKKIDYRRYRSGSSSDSAITLLVKYSLIIISYQFSCHCQAII